MVIGQGGAIRNGQRSVPYGKFLKITFVPSSSFGPYCDALFRTPPDRSICQKKNLKQRLFKVGNIILANFAYQIDKSTTPRTFKHAVSSRHSTKRSEDVVLETLPEEADG